MKNIRWGIIGCGDVTEVKSGPGFQKASNSELVAVMRRNATLAEDYARRHNVKKWYSNAEELINDPEVDAIYIATPPANHMEYTILSAKVGKPVYVEKPMARSFEECEAMIYACKQANVPLYVAYYRRALPRFIKVKELVEQGFIGNPRFVTITLYQKIREEELSESTLPWRVMPELAGGGRFMDLATHTLDILDFILGPIIEVKGLASNQGGLYKAEDVVSASFCIKLETDEDFSPNESKVYGTGMWSFTAFEDYDINEIVGDKGKIRFSTFGTEPIELITSDHKQEFHIENPQHIQQPLIQTIVNELLGKGICPSNGESGARTNKVIDEILKDYRKLTY